MKIERAVIETALHALLVCATDAELNAEEAQNATLREYYGRKCTEYKTAYKRLHGLVENNCFSVLDIDMSRSAKCVDCSVPACTVCADMRK